ncbi:hypothetical protein CGRA01v4_01937 [Colletotrichum graminicola]|nr:hypothetical protein CGRA01v4_01937 [Colletotrichum graminicola]
MHADWLWTLLPKPPMTAVDSACLFGTRCRGPSPSKGSTARPATRRG